MNNNETIEQFKLYMENNSLSKEEIEYNLKVVNFLVGSVLFYFNENLNNIDTFSFEEFTDKTNIIDDDLGGRDGIPKMLNSMLVLTEFLKVNRLIKGGKIAHYRRMFSKTNYYLEKYDFLTGKRDNSREFIKELRTNPFTTYIMNITEDINLYEIKTLDLIDKLLNDIPVKNSLKVNILKYLLNDLELYDDKGNYFEASKKGRMFSRLPVEEKYAIFILLAFYRADWNEVLKKSFNIEYELGFRDTLKIISSIFSKKDEVIVSKDYVLNKNENAYIEISKDTFRIARIESNHGMDKVIDIMFNDMSLINIKRDKNLCTYRVTSIGKLIFESVFRNSKMFNRDLLSSILARIKVRDYKETESLIVEYLLVYGGNSLIFDLLGQHLLIRKNYKLAYSVLKYGYETSSKRGKAARSLLYHLVLCCRKLKLEEDIQVYEGKLNKMSKV